MPPCPHLSVARIVIFDTASPGRFGRHLSHGDPSSDPNLEMILTSPEGVSVPAATPSARLPATPNLKFNLVPLGLPVPAFT